MEISIIIPTYNRRESLKECVEPLLNQDFKKEYEMIVVDDGSAIKDELLFSIIDNKKIRYVRKEHKGPAAARNYGIKIAKGKYVIFIGDDIICPTDFIKNHYNFLQQNKNSASIGNIVWHPDTPNLELFSLLQYIGLGKPSSDNPEDCGFNSFITSNIAVPKFYLDMEQFDEKFPYPAFEDIELGTRLYKRGLKIKYNKNALVYHKHGYTMESLKKRQWELGYSIGYFIQKHPEVKKMYVKSKLYIYLSFLLKMNIFACFTRINGIANCVYEKYKGIKEFQRYAESSADSIKRIVTLIKNDLSKNHSSLIFFVTSKCNQNCEFCFYSDNINKYVDLSLSEIESLSSKMGYISDVLFSGGEPFLRQGLSEIVDILVRNNKIKSLTVPSNGMSKELICRTVNQILLKCPFLFLKVCISLDGPEELHDKLRRVTGAYRKAIESIKALEHFVKKFERFSLNINTVITPKNVFAISDIIQNVKKLNIKYYTHSFEIVRPKSIKEAKPWPGNIDELRRAYNLILQYKDELYLRRLQCNTIKKLILGALHYANNYSLYKIQFDYSTKGKKWPMRCCAGLDENVIYNNGDLAICELQEPIANIKDISSDERLQDIFEKEREKAKNCYCTHICYILLSMYKSKKMLFLLMPLNAVRYFIIKLGLINYF